jgi:hypothetical protein
MIEQAIELIITYSEWLSLYVLAGLITLLILIQSWKRVHDSYEGIESAMTQIVLLSMIGWPYVLIVWILSWPVFSWAFWLRPVVVKMPKLPVTWWCE